VPSQAAQSSVRPFLPLLPARASGPGRHLAASDFAVGNLDLYLTSTCNRQCSYCFLSESFFSSKSSFRVDTVREIVAWALGSSIEEFTLLGGEPALHPDFRAILAAIRQAGFRVRIVTNGSPRFRRALRTPEVIAAIDRVAVSLDAPSAEIFDQLRGPRAFSDVKLTIRALRDLGKAFDINFTVVKSALPYVGRMLALAEELGACRINMHWFSEVGRGRTAGEGVSAAEWRRVLDEVSAHRPASADFVVDCELGFGFGLPGENKQMCAVRERTNLQFLPDGTVYSCGMMVDRPDLAGYKWIDGALYQRQGDNEVTRTAMSCSGCPMRGAGDALSSPVPLCIYNRLDRAESLHP
jgi:MoaA/NifB/PqqE/SkfB family radical SAM enzyme